MGSLVHRLTQAEAHWLRWFVITSEDSVPPTARLWGPIELREATGRAACRACGEKIPHGEMAIRFGFDHMEGHGHLAQSFIHRGACP